MPAPWGMGFAGAGWLGEALIKDLPSAAGRLHLAGVQDLSGDLAAEVAARHGGVLTWHGHDFEALLHAPGVDVVAISTPNAFHVPQAVAALAAGKHVLVQKPLACSPADARQALAAAEAAGRLLVVDYTYRFLDTLHALAEALPALGPVAEAEGVFRNIYGPGKAWFFDPAVSGGGALVDLGVHLLDLLLTLLRPQTATLRSAAFVRQHQPVESAAWLELDLDGVPARLEASWNEPLSATDIHLELRGARGRLRWENVDGSFFRFRTLLDGRCLLDRETTLRSDTIRALAVALDTGTAPAVDERVYDLVARAYASGAVTDRAQAQV